MKSAYVELSSATSVSPWYTGVDSLASPLFSLVIFVTIHYTEKARGQPLFTIFPSLMTPYNKVGPRACPATHCLPHHPTRFVKRSFF
jgi:hypothetical protein